ncbi:MAG: lysozyme inhibitor LprI family protein [Jannaschia sp.]
MKRALLLVGAGLASGSALAQDILFDPAPVAKCFAQAEEPRPGCIGDASALCQERTEGGTSTYGMVECSARETREWDRLLNVEYQALRTRLEAEDDGEGIDRSDALRDAQRAWIAYRDTECTLQYALYQEGTIRSIVGAGCVLGFTATRTLELRAMRQGLLQ